MLPPEIKTNFIQAVAFEIQCASILREVSQAAAERDIPVLVFKGAALALSAYPQAGQRGFGDLDIAVPQEKLAEFTLLLAELGFLGQDVSFLRNGIYLDLHTHPLHQLAEIVGPASASWWATAVPLGERAGAALRLSHENEFILALFHGAKHSFSRAGWVVDVALLAQKIGPDRVAELVQDYRVESQLSIAAICLERWFGCPLSVVPEAAPVLTNFFHRRFVNMILARKAPDYLGMLSPLRSAHSRVAALRYLWRNLYPKEIPTWQRTKQLIGMLKTLVIG